MNWHENQKVKIIKQHKSRIKVISHQNGSTPGAYVRIKINPKLNYKIKISGYKQPKCKVKLWIANNKRKVIYFSEEHGLEDEYSTIEYIFINDRKLSILNVGYLFYEFERGDFFIIDKFEFYPLNEPIEQVIKTTKNISYLNKYAANDKLKNIKLSDLQKNQKVSVKCVDRNCIEVISLQNKSTPGVYKIYKINPNFNYNIEIIGYKLTENDVCLWLGNTEEKFSEMINDCKLDSTRKSINHYFKNDNLLNELKVGLLFNNPQKNDKFVIDYINIYPKKKKMSELRKNRENLSMIEHFSSPLKLEPKNILIVTDKKYVGDILLKRLINPIKKHDLFKVDTIKSDSMSFLDIFYLLDNNIIINNDYDLILLSLGYNDLVYTNNETLNSIMDGFHYGSLKNIPINNKIKSLYSELKIDRNYINDVINNEIVYDFHQNRDVESNEYTTYLPEYIIKLLISKLSSYKNIKYIIPKVTKSDNIKLKKSTNSIKILKNLLDKDVRLKYKPCDPLFTTNEIIKSLINPKCDIVFNIRISPNDRPNYRLKNFESILKWFGKFKSFVVDSTVIIIEQYTERRINIKSIKSRYPYLNIEYHFLYNPFNFNRGWGYNYALKNVCKNKTSLLLDTDILFDSFIFQNISDINNDKYYFINPYKYIYWTKANERTNILSKNKINFNEFNSNKNPVSFSGGILICNKDEFLKLGGFEEFNSYGFEDRSLDIKIDLLVPPSKICIIDKTFIHLWHPKGKKGDNTIEISKEYFSSVYNCNFRIRPKKEQYIHHYCDHVSGNKLNNYVEIQKNYIGEKDIFKKLQFYQLTPNNLPKSVVNTIINTSGNNANIKFSKYLEGKRVAIVGPALSIKNTNQKDLIESYDIVVRINKSYPVPDMLKPDIGERTDILYNCLNPCPESGGKLHMKGLKRDVKWVCCPYPPIEPFDKNIEDFNKRNLKHKIDFNHIDVNIYNKLSEMMESRPNSGTAAMVDLLSYDITELYITGFTFFKGGYYKEYRTYNEEEVMERMKKAGHHNQEKQFEVMKQILENDDRVKTDNALKEILKNGL